MVPKIHKKGSSFKGAAMYLLHDKDRATTSDRVAWTATRNLATDNAHAAWRICAATAMSQERLKAEAGVKNTGRKSSNAVLHVTLSWHPAEAEGLTRDEMMRAASGAIRALGAEDRQTLLVAHDDEPQPHVHLLINRVSPVDGRMLSSSKERLRISKFALEYEQERGQILCEARAIAWKARDRSEYTRGEPDKPRHIHELEAANQDHPRAKAIAAEQKKLDYALARKTRELRARQADRLAALDAGHKHASARIVADATTAIAGEKDRIRAAYRPAWTARFHERQAALRAFERRESHLLGRVSNALRAVDFGSLLSGSHTGSERRTALSRAYNAMSSSGGRLEGLERAEAVKDRALERRQNADEARAVGDITNRRDRKLAERRALYRAERASLLLTHRLERAANRAEWRTRTEQRQLAWDVGRGHDGGSRPSAHAVSRLPLTSDEARRAVEGFMANRKRSADRGREQGRGRE